MLAAMHRADADANHTVVLECSICRTLSSCSQVEREDVQEAMLAALDADANQAVILECTILSWSHAVPELHAQTPRMPCCLRDAGASSCDLECIICLMVSCCPQVQCAVAKNALRAEVC